MPISLSPTHRQEQHRTKIRQFHLNLSPLLAQQKIVASSIGYHNASYWIDSIRSSSQADITIYLKPFIKYLGEIVVNGKRLKPDELLKEAIAVFPENYSQEPFNLEFYSTTIVKDSSSVIYQLETILLTYRRGYVQGASNWSKILQKRERGRSPLPPYHDRRKKKEYFPFTPAFDVSLLDQIGVGNNGGYTVFNPRKFDKMHFACAGISIFDEDTVARIEYSVRMRDIRNGSAESKGNYHGVLYIAINNLAIVRHTLKLE